MKKEHKLLLAIFLITLAVRLFFAFQTPYFSHEAYFDLRQIEHITEHGKPLFHDELGYGGRYFVFPPLFHYILAVFNLFLPIEIVAKVIPNLFASLLVVVVYLISKRITKNGTASLFSAFVAGFIPIFLAKTINNISVYSLLIPLIFYTLYCFLKIQEDKKYINYFVLLIFILPLVHQMAFLFIIGLLFYLILATVERLTQSKAEAEIILFSVFVIFWIQFLIYKQAFLVHGPAIIWQNIPTAILGDYFANLSILEAIYKIGVIPVIFGIFVIYQYIFRKKTRETYLLFGFALATGLLLWLKLIQLNLGFMVLGTILTILFSQFYKTFFVFLEKTKAEKYKGHITALFLIGFVLTSVVPSLIYTNQEIKTSLTKKEFAAMELLRENTKPNSVILAPLTDSYAIETIAQRKTMVDPNFLLIRNINQRFSDFKTLFTTRYETNAVRLLNKYNINYIYFSDNAKKEFNIEKLNYVANKKCFDTLHEDPPIYEVMCELEEE